MKRAKFLLNWLSVRLRYNIDYDSGSIFVALTLGLKLIFWYMDRFYEVQEDDAADETDEQHESK